MLNRDDSLLLAAEKRALEKRAQQHEDRRGHALRELPRQTEAGNATHSRDDYAAKPLRAGRSGRNSG